MDNRTLKARINKALANISKTRHAEIPLSDIFEAIRFYGVEPVDEDGSRWSGLLCGSDGTCRIKLSGATFTLIVGWYQMQSGRFEINTYVS